MLAQGIYKAPAKLKYYERSYKILQTEHKSTWKACSILRKYLVGFKDDSSLQLRADGCFTIY